MIICSIPYHNELLHLYVIPSLTSGLTHMQNRCLFPLEDASLWLGGQRTATALHLDQNMDMEGNFVNCLSQQAGRPLSQHKDLSQQLAGWLRR